MATFLFGLLCVSVHGIGRPSEILPQIAPTQTLVDYNDHIGPKVRSELRRASEISAFLSRDPFEGTLGNPMTRHPYMYAHNDPINMVDPSGNLSIASVSLSSFVIGQNASFQLQGANAILSGARQTFGASNEISSLIDGLQRTQNAVDLVNTVAFGTGVVVGLSKLSRWVISNGPRFGKVILDGLRRWRGGGKGRGQRGGFNGIASGETPINPIHPPLRYEDALQLAVREGVDLSKYKVTFVSRNRLRDIATAQGRGPAAATVPFEQISGGGLTGVLVERQAGRIPIRLDSRLLRNQEDLANAFRHEVAETEFILGFEGQLMSPRSLNDLLQVAHEIGTRAMR